MTAVAFRLLASAAVVCFIRAAEDLSRIVSLSNDASSGIVEAFRTAAAHCPLTPAIELIGEKWTILILRGSMSGLRHFEEFQSSLGIARNILSNRLGRLVAAGVLERRHDPVDRRRIVYTLTGMGADLLPTLIALRQWSEKWLAGPSRVILADRRSGKPLQELVARDHAGRAVRPGDLTWITAEPAPEPRVRSSATATAAQPLIVDYS